MRAETATATLGEWLRDARRRLADAGIASPRADAERLAAHALGIGWGDLWPRLATPLARAARQGADELCARRAGGEPMGYILGSVVFHGVEISCGPGVLVPRPETETLVDVALELIAYVRGPVVVDVGTGTGAIAIAVARYRPDASVWATDASACALDYARRNVAAAGVAVRLGHGDLLDALPAAVRATVDLVVCNPPYVPAGADLPRDVGAEPREALFAGPEGSEVLLRLGREAAAWLGPRGRLALEVGTPEQAQAVRHELRDFRETGVREDHTGRVRVVWATH